MDGQITGLLRRVHAGDSTALNDLLPLVYEELRRTARRHLSKERRDHTLQPTALVNEAFLRIFEHAPPNLSDRVHFLAVASRAMRHILVDYARARKSDRRGGDAEKVPLEPAHRLSVTIRDRQVELLDLELAMQGLAREDPALADAVEMQYFGGMTAEEIAEAVGRSAHVVRHQLRYSQAWLRRELANPAAK